MDTTKNLVSVDEMRRYLGFRIDRTELARVTCRADASKSLAGKYLNLSTPTVDFYFWFSVGGTGADPAVSGRTGIQVALAENDAAATVAGKLAAALGTDRFGYSQVSAVLEISCVDYGDATDAADGDSGFKVEVLRQGSNVDKSRDDDIEDLIDEVSDWMEGEAETNIKARSVTEYYNGTGKGMLFLNQVPVVSPAASIELWISTDEPRTWDATTKVSTDALIVDQALGIIHYLDGIFTEGPKTVKVTYTGGYETIPSRVKRAALVQGKHLWTKRETGADGAVSVSVAGATLSFEQDQVAPRFVRSVIDQIRSRKRS